MKTACHWRQQIRQGESPAHQRVKALRCVTAGPKGGSPAVCVDRFECCELAKTMCPFGPFPFSSGADVERPAPLRCLRRGCQTTRPVRCLRRVCRKTRVDEMDVWRRTSPRWRLLALPLGRQRTSVAGLGAPIRNEYIHCPAGPVPGFNFCLNPFLGTEHSPPF